MPHQLSQDVEQAGQDEEDTGITKSGNDEQKQDDVREETKDENPLEKYMRMVLEAREQRRAQASPTHACPELCFWDLWRLNVDSTACFWGFFQSPGREEGHSSPEAKSLSEEKDNR